MNRTRTDPQFVAELYCRHSRFLLNYLLPRIGGDRHLAEDLVQETFLRAWRAPDVGGLGGVGSCRAWLTTVARNLAIDWLRMRCRRPFETSDDELARVSFQPCETERLVTSLTVHDALAELAPETRAVLVAVYIGGHSMNEVAHELGVPLGTVKSRVRAALRELRCELAAPAVVSARSSAA